MVAAKPQNRVEVAWFRRKCFRLRTAKRVHAIMPAYLRTMPPLQVHAMTERQRRDHQWIERVNDRRVEEHKTGRLALNLVSSRVRFAQLVAGIF